MDSTDSGAAVIERATAGDVIELAMDYGPVPAHIGAILRFTGIPGGDPAATERLIADRARTVPRLRQRLVRAPLGCGPPVWQDDPAADPERHVRAIRCPAPGDDRALLDLAARVMTTRLPRAWPLWSATVVTGLTDGTVAVLVVLHHIMADGIGGLAVLSALADGAQQPGPLPPPLPPPTRGQLATDAMARRRQALRRLPATTRSVRRWLGAAGGSRPERTQACALIGPVGPRRAYEIVWADVAPLRELAHSHGATVNDTALIAITAALGDLLAARGEAVDPITVGVPVSLRRSATTARLGNQVAPILVPVPVTGHLPERLERLAAAVRTARAAANEPPPAGVATVMWWTERLGLLRRYMTHQRRLHTMVSSIHGPDDYISIGGSTVTSIVPLAAAETGNVRISFVVLSYAGTLTVTAIADPDAVPDLPGLAGALRSKLDAVTVSRAASQRRLPGGRGDVRDELGGRPR